MILGLLAAAIVYSSEPDLLAKSTCIRGVPTDWYEFQMGVGEYRWLDSKTVLISKTSGESQVWYSVNLASRETTELRTLTAAIDSKRLGYPTIDPTGWRLRTRCGIQV